MDQILAKLSPKENNAGRPGSMNHVMPSKYAEKQANMGNQCLAAFRLGPTTSSAGPVGRPGPVTTSAFGMKHAAMAGGNDNEVVRLKQELIAANSRIAMQEQEIAQNRVIKHTLEQAMGPPSEADFGGREVTEQTISSLQNAFNASTRPYAQRQDAWMNHDDAHSDISEAVSAAGYNRSRGTWNNSSQHPVGPAVQGTGATGMNLAGNPNMSEAPRDWTAGGFGPNQRIFSGPGSPVPFGFDNRHPADNGPGFRRPASQANRGGSCFPPQNTPWGTFPPMAPGGNSVRPAQQQFAPMYPGHTPYQPRPIGTPLSPTAAEFTSMSQGPGSWVESVSIPLLCSMSVALVANCLILGCVWGSDICFGSRASKLPSSA